MAMDDLRTIIGRDIHAVVACESQIDAYIERMYARARHQRLDARPQRPGLETRQEPPSSPASAVAEPGFPCHAEPHAQRSLPSRRAGAAPRRQAPNRHAPSSETETRTARLDLPSRFGRAAPASEVGDTAKAGDRGRERARWRPSCVEAPPRRRQLLEGRGHRQSATPGLAELLVSSGQVTREEMEAALRGGRRRAGPSARS